MLGVCADEDMACRREVAEIVHLHMQDGSLLILTKHLAAGVQAAVPFMHK